MAVTADGSGSRIARGTVLGGRYAIEERIARGGVGEVWAARDMSSGKKTLTRSTGNKTDANEVAIKTLRSFYRDHDEVRARFAREGELLKRIDSPHVCKLLDVFCDDEEEEPFLVFERLHGDSLDRLLKGGHALPFQEVRVLIDEIFSGLMDAHAVGVVHRDLKPANVFVVVEPQQPQRVKLIDFGISKLLASDGPSLTTANATLGSPQYMAPEQLGGSRAADERCDTYAAGTIAFRALTGTLPFDPKDAVRLLALKQRSSPATLEEATHRPWPKPLQEFFDCVLARDREDRPRTAEDAREEWRSACACAVADLSADGMQQSAKANDDDHALEDEETPILERRR